MTSRPSNLTFKLVLLGDVWGTSVKIGRLTGRAFQLDKVRIPETFMFCSNEELSVVSSYSRSDLQNEVKLGSTISSKPVLRECCECSFGRVGKTSLVLRYVNDVFSDKQEATVQAAYLTKRLLVEGVPITLAIWDTAGQERFHALGPIYYRDADAALLVYDITDKDTFVRVTNWVKELQQLASKNIVMTIAGNKSDLIRSKKFDVQDAENYASSIGSRHFVTSAKFGTGIDELFLHIATRLYQLRKENEEVYVTPARKGIVVIDDEPEKEPQQKCCT